MTQKSGAQIGSCLALTINLKHYPKEETQHLTQSLSSEPPRTALYPQLISFSLMAFQISVFQSLLSVSAVLYTSD
jgi:hypothetical protein